MTSEDPRATERQITHGHGGRILTNTGVWSPDGEWIVYDTRSDAAGEVFDGQRIEMVHLHTGAVRVLFEAKHGAHCGVATFHPREWRVVFILGPEHPTPDWQYSAAHRQGIILSIPLPPVAQASSLSPVGQASSLHSPSPLPLDARDLTPPFTPGALRGGSHVHVWHPAGDWVSFTYEDHVLSRFTEPSPNHDLNQRNLGLSLPGRPVRVPKSHPRNHDGTHFSVLVTRTTARPRPGSDEISRAFEEAWIGTNGYLRPDGTQQRRALAFQGHVLTPSGQTISEVFVADLPDDPTHPGPGPLAGTEIRLPAPPRGVTQRRLTCTAGRPHPGLQGPRHWLRASPDGARIAFLAKDDAGIVQLWTVSPNGGPPAQLTRNPWPIASAFTWSGDGRWIAHVMDQSVCLTDLGTGQTCRLTPRAEDHSAPRPEACVFSPDGRRIAYIRRVAEGGAASNQIFVATLEP